MTSLVTKKLNQIVTEIFFIGEKLSISTIFITQFYFAVLKNVRLNGTFFFSLRTLQTNERFSKVHLIIHLVLAMMVYKKCTAKPYSFLVIDNNIALDNPLHFRRNL